MQIVIEISEDSYKATCDGSMLPPHVENIVQSIKNGIPLPKRYGNIYLEKDIRAFLKCKQYDFCTWKNCSECNNRSCITEDNLYKVNAVIEVDKAESEVEK